VSASIRIAWREVVTTRYDVEVPLEDLPASLRTGDGRHLSAAQLDTLRGWLVEAGNDSLSGAADLQSVDVQLEYLGRRRVEPVEEDDEHPLPYVGNVLRIWFAGGTPDGITGEVTQVTGSVVTLGHVETYDLALADRWQVVEPPAGFGPARTAGTRRRRTSRGWRRKPGAYASRMHGGARRSRGAPQRTPLRLERHMPEIRPADLTLSDLIELGPMP
jgi:hypothetical protein